jgi:AAA+ ATPase superfamily predicted ATPase
MKQKEEEPRNPFQFGVVIDGAAFCNRKDEITFLKNQIINGYSTWLFSPRRFGKTSLVEKVFRETKSATCIFVDLYNIKSIDEFGNPSFTLNVNRIEQQTDIETILEIPNRISKQRGQHICVAFDEFQEIQRIDPFLLNWMRSTFQRHQGISYIFLGSKQSLMEDIFASTRSPFYEFAVKMNLSVINKEDLFSFIKEKFSEHDLTIQENTINNILKKSECQPHYTQYFASVVFDLVKSGYDQCAENFTDTWLNKVMLSQVDIFQDIFDQLTNAQRSVLQAISRLENMGIYSDQARRLYNLPVSSSINEALKALQKKALIYKSVEGYKFSNPVLGEWLITLV